MNKLQECQFKMLKKFIEVCKKYNLRYYLIGGTALGAVRHKGFIPWDDDIDVAMPRPDYDKFITLQKDFEDPFFIQTYHSDKNYIYNYAKLRNSSTTFIESYFALNHMNQGVWIDIFPLDGMSYKNVEPKTLGRKVRSSWHQAWAMYPYALKRRFSFRTLYLDIPLNLCALICSFLNVGQYRNKMLDRQIKKIPFDKALLVGNLLGTDSNKQAMPLEIYGKGSVGTFEGIEVMLPENYDEYLTRIYGDYMQLPPKEKQVGHHYNKGFSLEIGYKEYFKKHHI